MRRLLLFIISVGSVLAQTSGMGTHGGISFQTTSYTTQASDYNTTIYANCPSACTITLLGTPYYSYTVAVESVGSSVATISLNGLNYNGSSTAPTLISYRSISFVSDGNNYFGEVPFMAGANMSFTSSSNSVTLSV